MSGQNRDLVDRYRRAAEETLEQLDWCVGFLSRIRKDAEARGLAANRRSIREAMQAGPVRG